MNRYRRNSLPLLFTLILMASGCSASKTLPAGNPASTQPPAVYAPAESIPVEPSPGVSPVRPTPNPPLKKAPKKIIQAAAAVAERPVDEPVTPSISPLAAPSIAAPPTVQVAPVVPESPAIPPTPPSRRVTIPAGALIPVRTVDSVDSSRDQAGQMFRASIDSAITVDGQIVVPKGAEVVLQLRRVSSAGELRGKSELQLQLDHIIVGNKSYAAESNVIERSGAAEGSNTVRDVAIGAALGAAIGAMTGGGKSAAAGAGVGAGAGVAVAAMTRDEQVLVPSESRLDFRLEQPIEMDLPTAPLAGPATESSALSGPRKLGEDSSAWPRREPDRQTRANLSGEWDLTINGPQGRRTLRLVLDQDGHNLKGTIQDPMRGKTSLRGTVEDYSVRFSTESVVLGRTVLMRYTGTIAGNRLRGTMTTQAAGGYGTRGRRGGRPPIDERPVNWTAQWVR